MTRSEHFRRAPEPATAAYKLLGQETARPLLACGPLFAQTMLYSPLPPPPR
jgi:hypothetical protein